MKKLKPMHWAAAWLASLAVVASPIASAALTRVYTDEIKSVAVIGSLGIAQGELLSTGLTKVGRLATDPLRLYASGTDSLLHIGASLVSNGDGVGKVPPPIGGSVQTAFADTTIDFQANSAYVSPSGNALTDGATFALPSTTIGQFRQMVLVWRSDGKVDTHFSPAAASLGALEDPGTTFAALPGTQKLGYILLQATAAQKFKTAGSATNIIEAAVSGVPKIIKLDGIATASLTDGVSGILPIANGGLATSSVPSNGQIPIGNGTGYTVAAITGTANRVTVTNGAGTITLSGPQDIAAASSPTFVGLTLSGLTPAGFVKNSVGGVLSTASSIVLTTDVSGVLPTANGGTGQNSTATFPTSGVVTTNAGTATLSGKTISASANTITGLVSQTDLTGDGVTTDFTLTGVTLAANNFVMVFIDGRMQKLTADYTRTNANPGHIIFTSAPDNGSVLTVVVVNQN